jgi:putative flippase GtrA
MNKKKLERRLKSLIKKIPLLNFLYKKRFVHFFLVAAIGFIINIIVTASLTELVFGREKYFIAYIIGLTTNLLFNFAMHVKITFKTKRKNLLRFVGFMAYNIGISIVNASLVKTLVNLTNTNLYLPIIIIVTVILFTINFLVSKYILFKEIKN